MLRALIYGLSILHLGPGFAFAVMAFGCEDEHPWLNTVCQGDTFAAFIRLTLAAWAVMIVAVAAMQGIRWIMRKSTHAGQ